MRKITVLILILFSTTCFGQMYADLNAVLQLPMDGKIGLDVGFNLPNNVSIEGNVMLGGYARYGSSIGYQFGERESEWPGLRLYGGASYGKYYMEDKEGEFVSKTVRPMLGAKFTMGSLSSSLTFITDFKGQPETYVTVGIQLVTAYKFLFR